jgi:tetratricopeptide (TPR) repeat protein
MSCLALLILFGGLFLGQPDIPHIKSAQAAYDEGKKAQSDRQFGRAADCFRKAIEIEPTFLNAREALITTYLDSGEALDAAEAITQFLEIEPDALKYRLLLGQILLQEKQPQKALAQFSIVLKRDPDNADGLLGFATAATAVGMKERATTAIEHGKKRYPADERFKNLAGASQQ